MATTFSLAGQIKLTPKLVEETTTQTADIYEQFSLSNGSGTGQANCMWHSEISVESDTSQEFNLQALAYSVLGVSGTRYFWKIKSVYVHNTSDLSTVTAFDTTDNPWLAVYGAPVTLPPGDLVYAFSGDGWEVTSTSKVIKLTNDEVVYTVTGDQTSGSKVISDIDDTTDIVVGMTVTQTNVPAGTKVISKTSSTITMSAASTATDTAVGFTITKPPAVLVVSLAGVLD
jgi:hypothetical protein